MSTPRKPLTSDDLDHEVRKVLGRGVYALPVITGRLRDHLRKTFGHVVEDFPIETYSDLLRLPTKFIPAMMYHLLSEEGYLTCITTDRPVAIAAAEQDRPIRKAS